MSTHFLSLPFISIIWFDFIFFFFSRSFRCMPFYAQSFPLIIYCHFPSFKVNAFPNPKTPPFLIKSLIAKVFKSNLESSGQGGTPHEPQKVITVINDQGARPKVFVYLEGFWNSSKIEVEGLEVEITSKFESQWNQIETLINNYIKNRITEGKFGSHHRGKTWYTKANGTAKERKDLTCKTDKASYSVV